jgi:uncharacterized tellurite resistance protein B-like protein
MLESIRQFVARRITPGRPGESTGPAGAEVQLAACALLLELAHADNEFSESERIRIQNALTHHFGLDGASARDLIELARAERAQSIDHFQFTRLINEQYDLGQKMVLAEVMWGVILADGKLSDHETHLVRKLASLMQLEPAYLAQARRAASEAR